MLSSLVKNCHLEMILLQNQTFIKAIISTMHADAQEKRKEMN